MDFLLVPMWKLASQHQPWLVATALDETLACTAKSDLRRVHDAVTGVNGRLASMARR
jgi:hypothetical protein